MKIDYNKRWDQQKKSHSYHPSVRLRNRFILDQLKKISFTSLMDVGCGDGYLLSLIKHKFPHKQYAGIDISNEIILQNQQKYPGINFFQGDLGKEAIPVTSGYDVVVCSEVIEHIADRRQVIKNLAKLVNKQGYLILTTQSGKRYKSDINIGHLKHFTLSELEQECMKYGLHAVQSYKKGFPFYNLQKRLYEKIENQAKNIQSGEINGFTKILFTITYYLFLLSLRSQKLGPQIFMILQKK